MRKPDERRCKAVASWLPDVDRLRCAFSDITLVLIESAIVLSPQVIRKTKLSFKAFAGRHQTRQSAA
jgi:hypothetical protein